MTSDAQETCNEKAAVLGDTSAAGKPEGENDGRWRQKLSSRTDELKYLKSAERYWYGEGSGSEKRKKPA
jgi:hypothetical protein